MRRRRSDTRRWKSLGKKNFSKVSGGERRITAPVAVLRRILRDWDLSLRFPADLTKFLETYFCPVN